MKKIIQIVTIILCCTNYHKAQKFIQPEDTSLLQIMARYDTIPVDTANESRYRRWLRFKSYYTDRLAPDFEFKKMNNAYSSFYQSLNSQQIQPPSAGVWQNLGPNKTQNNVVNIGRLDKLQIDPDDVTGNTIYVASVSGGGIFKTVDGGANWINYHTDYAFGTTGVTDIVLIKDPITNKKYLYAAVGGGGGNNSLPFNGIYRSEIGTTTWQNLTGNLNCPIMLPPNATSTVNKILIDPTNLDNIFLATSKGVFYTCVFPCTTPIANCSPGLVWQSSTLKKAILGIAFDYSDPTYKSLYASGTSVWATSDVTLGFTNIGCNNVSNTSLFNNFTTMPTGLPGAGINKVIINIATHPNYPNLLYMITALNGSKAWLMKYDKNSANAFPNNFLRHKEAIEPGAMHDDKMFINFSPTMPNVLGYSTGGVKGESSYYGHVHLFNVNTNNWYLNNTTPSNSNFAYNAQHDDAHDFALFGNYLYMTSDGGLVKVNYAVYNPVTNYQSLIGNGLGISTIFGLSVYEKTDKDALIGMQDCGTKKTSDLNGPNNWLFEEGSDGGPNAFLSNKDYFISTSYAYSIFFKETSNNINIRNIGYDCADQPSFIFNYYFKSINGNKDIYVPGRELSYNNDPSNSGACSNPIGWHTISDIANQTTILMGNNNACSWQSNICDYDVSTDNKRIYLTDFPWGVYGSFPNCLALNPAATYPVLWRANNGGINNPAVTSPCTSNCWTPLGTQNSLKLIGMAKAVCMNPNNVDELWVSSSGYYSSGVNNRRVIHSTDGGATFSDFSTGLPNFPVNKLIFRKGTNYEIYAATDIGVYYRTASMSSWQRLGTNLPFMVVYDIQINNCTQKLYAGTYGRGMWAIDLPAATNKIALPVTTITQTLVINSPQYYFNNISIPYATKLIINNTNIYMGPNTSINIEPGGQLEINNSTIQGYCDNKMWHGIFVKGNPAQTTYYDPNLLFFPYNGTVRMNNSTIRDADVAAVSLGGHDLLTTGYIWNTGGGQVFADNCTFTNNFKDFEFFPYSFKNKSYARNCTFQVTGQMKSSDITPDTRISAWGVNGMNFLGCTFQNTALPTDNLGVKGSGISSIDSYYLVANYCPQISCYSNPNGGTPTNFKNLLYGIYATGTGSQLNTITIRNTNFDNTYYGTYISGISYASVWRCNYTNIPMGGGFSPSPYPKKAAYGLYFNGSSNFFCENNAFTGVSGGDKNIGCIVNNSQYNANQVYNCDFTNLGVGSAAYNDNLGPNSVDGLKYNCNKYASNAYDICILSTVANDLNTDIYPLQGTYQNNNPLALVRNLYSATCNSNENEYYSDKASAMQVVHIANPTESGNGGTFNTNPPTNCKDGLILTIAQGGNFTRNETSCKSSNPVGGGKGIGVVTTPCTNCTERQILNNQISALKVEYTNENNRLLIGGSATLVAAVSDEKSDPSDITNLLVSNSPYLSDEVLMAFFMRKDLSSEEILKVHELNAPVSADVWEIIGSLELSSEVVERISHNQNVNLVSGLTHQKGYVNALLSNLQYAYNSKARSFIEDSIVNLDSVRAIISNNYFTDSQLKMVDYYIDRQQYSNALAQISTVSSGVPQHQNWATFKNLQITLLQSTNGYLTLKTNQSLRQQVQQIAGDISNPMHLQASAILYQAIGTKTDEYTGLPALENNERLKAPDNNAPSTLAKIRPDVFLSAVPNPANIDVTVNYKLPKDVVTGTLRVIDIMGRVMYKTEVINSLNQVYINAKEWANGMYYYSLIVDNQVIATKTIIINK